MKKIVLILLLLGLLGGIYVWFFVYNKSHVNYQKETAAFVGNADEFAALASENPEEFTAKYLNKAVEISGSISESGTKTVLLNNSIFCTFLAEQNIPELNSSATIKGRFVGLEDDLISGKTLCKLDNCIVK